MYPFFPRFYSRIGHYRVLSRVPCAIQKVLFFFIRGTYLLYILYILVYLCQSQSPNYSHHHHPPHHFPPLVSTCVFFTSVSLFLPCKPIHLYNFSRFHVYELICGICFSLSDLFHSVWESLYPSMSQQITQFCSFLWLNNIPLYICTTSSLSIHPFFFFKHLYWSIISLQLCVSYCFITKWISYTYTYVPISLPFCISLPPTLPIPPL